ncbi:OmpH family outer membrane protein [Deinococcus sp.]|uniref:OmpH family outer membrane protein n=1 Tax=Deinococcus sp. TaxID=47478 RepID=UPI003C7A3417
MSFLNTSSRVRLPKSIWLAPLALLAVQPHAQQSKTRLGIVNVQSVVAALPGGSGFVSLSRKADTDVQAQAKSVQALLSKARAAGASAADKNAYTAAAKKYQVSAQGYQKQLQTAFAPLATRVNAAVASVARASGYSVVIDARVASQNRLVIYANAKATDLTAAVAARLKAGK